MKRTLSLLLALVLALSVCGVSALAVATPLEGGNSQATATNIPSYGMDYVSSLSTAGEEDWFKFTTLYEVAYYYFNYYNSDVANGSSLNGSSNSLHIALYDMNLKEIHDIYGGMGESFSAYAKLEPNTVYYLKVYHRQNHTGSYQFGITYKFDAVRNTPEQASWIQVNQKNVSSIDAPDDADWYYFIAPANGTYTVYSKNYNIPNGTSLNSEHNKLHILLYDVYMQELLHEPIGKNESFSRVLNLERGQKYLFYVYHSFKHDIGNYELSVSTDLVSSAPAKILKSVSVASLPNKTTYQLGEPFDQTGMVVRAVYDGASAANVSDFSVTGYNAALPGTQTLIVSYTEGVVEKTTTFTVKVQSKKTLTGITIVSEPTKKVYTVGETLDMNGFALNGEYSDGTTARITDYQVSGFDSSTAGQKTVTVSVQENNTVFAKTFTVTVNEKQSDPDDGLQKFLNFLSKVWKPLVTVVRFVLNLFSALAN